METSEGRLLGGVILNMLLMLTLQGSTLSIGFQIPCSSPKTTLISICKTLLVGGSLSSGTFRGLLEGTDPKCFRLVS